MACAEDLLSPLSYPPFGTFVWSSFTEDRDIGALKRGSLVIAAPDRSMNNKCLLFIYSRSAREHKTEKEPWSASLIKMRIFFTPVWLPARLPFSFGHTRKTRRRFQLKRAREESPRALSSSRSKRNRSRATLPRQSLGSRTIHDSAAELNVSIKPPFPFCGHCASLPSSPPPNPCRIDSIERRKKVGWALL